MSFNRGVKRNSGGSFIGNRSFGNSGGGGGGGGRSLGGGMGGGPVSRGMSPWESGSMPGRGILPTPNNNLSINSPQAELVIVSNLLNNLIRTQQDTQPQVPSLLSLGTGINGPGTNFRGQQNFVGSGRFNDRQMRQGNIKNQRPQPYNKMGNRARDGVAGRRGPSSAQQSRAQSQSGNQRINGNQNQHRNDKNSKANASKQNQANKKEQQDLKKDNAKPDNENIVKSELKEEKKESEETTEADDSEEKPAEENDNNESEDKSAKTDKKTDDKDANGKKSEARHAESRYAAVPIGQMFCHVCNKHMWDGNSFENHLRGRAHQLMMDKLDESYKLKVDLMRHELRVSEEQRGMSLTNSKRRGKKVSVDLNVREYCTMCDLNFYGTLSNHRKSDKHQQLKTFLHPRCASCVKEFPSRIEYDEHCLTPAHMAQAAKNEDQKKSKRSKIPKGESEVRSATDEEKDSVQDGKTNDKEEELPPNVEYITEILEEIDSTKHKIPSFKYCRQKQLGVGASMVKEIQGFHCEKCRRFMLTTEDMQAHLRTLTHYRNFVSQVKALTTPPPAAETTTETSEKSNEEDVSAKRQKLDESVTDNENNKTIDDEENAAEEKEDAETQNDQEDDKQVDENEKYDPMEDENEYEGEEKKEDGNNGENDDQNNSQDETCDVWGEVDEEENDIPNDDLNDSIDDPKETIDPPKVVDDVPKSTDEAPKIVNDVPKATNDSPKIINESPKVAAPKVAEVVAAPAVQKEKVPETPNKIDDDIPPPPPAPIISNQTPQSNKNSVNNSPRTPNTPNTPMHTPGKSPRGGRGGFRGGNRGHQRARRSRR